MQKQLKDSTITVPVPNHAELVHFKQSFGNLVYLGLSLRFDLEERFRMFREALSKLSINCNCFKSKSQRMKPMLRLTTFKLD